MNIHLLVELGIAPGFCFALVPFGFVCSALFPCLLLISDWLSPLSRFDYSSFKPFSTFEFFVQGKCVDGLALGVFRFFAYFFPLL